MSLAMKTKHLIFAIPIILTIVLADQLTKWLIVEHVVRGGLSEGIYEALPFWEWLVSSGSQAPFYAREITSFFNLVMVWNQGISFGLLSAESLLAVHGLTALTALIALGFLVWLFKTSRVFLAVPLTLVIAGAFGNIIDRLRFGAVIDFLDFHVAGWHYPAFNLADSCITIGIVLIAIDSFFADPKSANTDETRETGA